MRYLVEIIYKNGLTPVYLYYSNFSEIKQMILKSDNIDYIEVYKIDNEKSKIATKLTRK